MAERTVRLVYPTALMNVPVVHQLIRQFNVTVNILRAQINDNQGWLEMQVNGSDTDLAKAFDWLEGLKIEIILLPPRSEG